MECFEKGVITREEADGLNLEWGNAESILELTRKIAYQEGIGALLSGDVREAARRIGKGSERYAMHVKGLSTIITDPRGHASWGLALAVSSRGCDHHRGAPSLGLPGMSPEFAEKVWRTDKVLDRFSPEGKGYLVKWHEDHKAIIDSLEVCKLARERVFPLFEDLLKVFNIVTGFDFSVNELMRIGARISTLERMFNVREGMTRKDDYWPDRMLKEPMPEGPAKGHVVPLEPMLKDYYKERGYDWETGIPSKSVMEGLGFKKDIEEMEELRRSRNEKGRNEV
jgi:aldehyde:ferredoxin oxidoreductase